jgi:phage FluMu protein Com
MLSEKYIVSSCRKCNKPILMKVQFQEYEGKCCLDFNSQKILKIFNDEKEAKNYYGLHKQEEE